MWQSVLQFFSEQFQRLIDAVSLGRSFLMVSQQLASQLPSNWYVSAPISDARSALSVYLGYIAFLDYFINLPVFFGVMSLIAFVEAGMMVPRMWRFVRSFIT